MIRRGRKGRGEQDSNDQNRLPLGDMDLLFRFVDKLMVIPVRFLRFMFLRLAVPTVRGFYGSDSYGSYSGRFWDGSNPAVPGPGGSQAGQPLRPGNFEVSCSRALPVPTIPVRAVPVPTVCGFCVSGFCASDRASDRARLGHQAGFWHCCYCCYCLCWHYGRHCYYRYDWHSLYYWY